LRFALIDLVHSMPGERCLAVPLEHAVFYGCDDCAEESRLRVTQ